MNTIRHTKLKILAACCLLAIPFAHQLTLAGAQAPGVAGGKTAILTPEGTLIVPPTGAPLAIIADAENVTTVLNGSSWGLGSTAPQLATLTSCTDYQTGWYETNQGYVWGGHMGTTLRNLPLATSQYCAGMGSGYTDGVSFGGSNWIQAGLVLFPGESSAKWMCQANDNGALTTKYGPANAYGNGVTVYTWFARDSSGVWRTYRYDTGPYSVELGCTLTRGDSGGHPLTVFGEVQGAMSTSAPMGPWDMLDLRYLATNNQWSVPSTLQSYYGAGTPCPPYGAGTVSAGKISAGSAKACTTGTSAYPN